MNQNSGKHNPTLILFASVTAAVLVVANISSLNVALPELSRELGASQSDARYGRGEIVHGNAGMMGLAW